MRLPLLIHGKPSSLIGVNLATVSLSAGRWKIIHDVVDSEVYIMCLRTSSCIEGNGTYSVPSKHQLKAERELIMEGNTSIQVLLDKPGTENHLSIYAELTK